MKRITKIEAAKDSGRKKLRVAAYGRVSTDSNEQLVSLETQMNHYERYIKARPDWEYAGLYYDEGVTWSADTVVMSTAESNGTTMAASPRSGGA